jgi:hypothetical protein
MRIERRINTAEWVCPLLANSGHGTIKAAAIKL